MLDMTDGAQVAKNQSGDQVIKTGSGRVVKVAIINGGSEDGFIHDCATIGEATIGNALAVLPQSIQVIDVNMPFQNGLVLASGLGQVIAISYN